MDELSSSEKSELKKLAFETASMLSCNQINPTSDSILLEADKFYKWLTEGDKNNINNLKSIKNVN